MIYHRAKSVILTDKIGKNCRLHAPVWIGRNVKIGDKCRIQAFAYIPEGVVLEDDVFVSPGVIFTNDSALTCKGKKYWKKTLVKKGAKIGAGAVIRAGIIIGKNAIVGMGAVVLKDVLDGETVVGNPAKKL